MRSVCCATAEWSTKFSTGTESFVRRSASGALFFLLFFFFFSLLRDLFWFAFGGSNSARFHPANCGMVFLFCLPQGLSSWQVGGVGERIQMLLGPHSVLVPVGYLYWQSNPWVEMGYGTATPISKSKQQVSFIPLPPGPKT